MTLSIKISQKIGREEISASAEIILDDMKHSPELAILGKIQELKRQVIKQIDETITKQLNNQAT